MVAFVGDGVTFDGCIKENGDGVTFDGCICSWWVTFDGCIFW